MKTFHASNLHPQCTCGGCSTSPSLNLQQIVADAVAAAFGRSPQPVVQEHVEIDAGPELSHSEQLMLDAVTAQAAREGRPVDGLRANAVRSVELRQKLHRDDALRHAPRHGTRTTMQAATLTTHEDRIVAAMTPPSVMDVYKAMQGRR